MKVTHAGAVTYRRTGTGPLFLIISSSDGAHWVLPKGRIRESESLEMAATLRNEKVNVQYFLVEEVGDDQPKESRIIRWENEQSALKLLSFEESRRILMQM